MPCWNMNRIEAWCSLWCFRKQVFFFFSFQRDSYYIFSQHLKMYKDIMSVLKCYENGEIGLAVLIIECLVLWSTEYNTLSIKCSILVQNTQHCFCFCWQADWVLIGPCIVMEINDDWDWSKMVITLIWNLHFFLFVFLFEIS